MNVNPSGTASFATRLYRDADFWTLVTIAIVVLLAVFLILPIASVFLVSFLMPTPATLP